MRHHRSFLALLVVFTVVMHVRAEQPLATSTIVVYNKSAPDSPELARFYAKQRGIASDHIIGLTCSVDEEITREEYDGNIAEPLREAFKSRKWWTIRETAEHQDAVLSTSIRFVALIKGMPLKIKPTAVPYPGDESAGGPIDGRNEASVDSEIATLGYFSPKISGAKLNTYFKSFRAIDQWDDVALLLVCRLDAPSVATVRQMIIDSVAAERTGLWGRAYVDSSHGPSAGYEIGDQWLAEIPQQLHKVGIPVVYQSPVPGIFPEGYPMTDCALYYGWYYPNVAGPFANPDFHFVPGAIAVHIHSFSANTLRDANANWVAPLISKGAAASLGYVYEPFLQLTAHLDTFNDRLLHGFTFAESAYMSIPALSWMSVMVGDPLYRPYASWLQIDALRDSAKSGTDWKTYHEFAVKNVTRPVSEFRTLARQAASRTRNCPMIEDLGLIESRDGNFSAATSYFQQARTCYAKRDDLLRVVLEETDAWIKQNKPKRALALVRSVLRVVPDAPAAPLLRKIEQDLTAPPAASPAKP